MYYFFLIIGYIVGAFNGWTLLALALLYKFSKSFGND